MGETFSLLCLLDERINEFYVVFVLVSIGECLQDFLVIDKILRVF